MPPRPGPDERRSQTDRRDDALEAIDDASRLARYAERRRSPRPHGVPAIARRPQARDVRSEWRVVGQRAIRLTRIRLVLFLNLSGVPEFAILVLNVGIQLIGVFKREMVGSYQLNDIIQVARPMSGRHAAGGL